MNRDGVAGRGRRGAALVAARRYELAIPVLREELAATPDDAQLLNHLAYALLVIGEHGESLEVANGALGVEPQDEWSNRLRSLALKNLGRYKESLLSALEAQRIAPYEWNTHTTVADIQMLLGRLPEAEAAARKAVELAPNVSGTHTQLAWVLLQQQDIAGSRESARRALRIDPDLANARNVLGVLDRIDRVEPSAREHFLAASRSELRDQTGRTNLADSVFEGSYKEATVWRMLVAPLSLGFGLGAFGPFGLVAATLLLVLVRTLFAEFRMRNLPSQTRSYVRRHRRDRWRPSMFKGRLRIRSFAVGIVSLVRRGWAGPFIAMWLSVGIVFLCGWAVGLSAR